jgi:hypothetical protein
MSNFSKNIAINNCSINQTFDSFGAYFECYSYFYKLSPVSASLQIILCVGVILANSRLIWCLSFKEHKNIFDKIFIGHGKFINVKFIHTIY